MSIKPALWCLFSPALPLIRQMSLSISSLAVEGTNKTFGSPWGWNSAEGLWLSLGEQHVHSVPSTAELLAEILRNLAANLHPRNALSVLPSLKGLMASCRSLGGCGAAEFTAVSSSHMLSLFLIMPMTTLRAK